MPAMPSSNLSGGEGNDVLTQVGDGSALGNAGNDTIVADGFASGGDGDDSLRSLTHADGGAGDDTMFLGEGVVSATFSGKQGNDTLVIEANLNASSRAATASTPWTTARSGSTRIASS